jgi:hypothetical protein
VRRPSRNCELVRLEDRDHAIDAGGALEVDPGDVLAVADRPDHGQLAPVDDMRSGADRLNSLDDGLHLLLGGRRFHHDHHFSGPFCEFEL